MLPNIGPMELVLLLGLGVLLFGKRLPEVGRSLGRGIVEFKKGLNGVTDEFDITSTNRYSSSSSHRSEEPATASSAYSDASVPKFELPGTPSNSSASASASSASASSSAPVPQMEYPPATSQD
jgi:sec-independent protein translocase protein TatA